MVYAVLFFFFFQAEDGIRDVAVTGVQTCALPLTALKGTIEVALRAERSGEEYRRVLASSLEDVERLVRLAEDLLLLSRLSVPAQVPRERVELEPLLVEVADIAARLADARGVVFVVKERAPAAVAGGALALRRAVLHPIENAGKYPHRAGRPGPTLGL